MQDALSEFGLRLGEATARYKRAGFSDRAERYRLAFAEFKKGDLITRLRLTKPQEKYEGDESFLIYDPESRRIGWVLDSELEDHSLWTPEQIELNNIHRDGLNDDGVLLYHFTPNGYFILYGYPYGYNYSRVEDTPERSKFLKTAEEVYENRNSHKIQKN